MSPIDFLGIFLVYIGIGFLGFALWFLIRELWSHFRRKPRPTLRLYVSDGTMFSAGPGSEVTIATLEGEKPYRVVVVHAEDDSLSVRVVEE